MPGISKKIVQSASGRRKFIGQMSLLMAGAIYRPATNIFYGQKQALGAQAKELWKSFCQNKNASSLIQKDLFGENKPIATMGHRYDFGESVLLEKDGVVAQPIWIYWDGVDKNTPSDLLVCFFDVNNHYNKLKTIDRYELSVLNDYFDGTSITNSNLPLHSLLSKKNNINLIAKTTIRTKNDPSVYSFLKSDKIDFHHNIA